MDAMETKLSGDNCIIMETIYSFFVPKFLHRFIFDGDIMFADRVCWALGRLGHTDPELMNIAAAQLRSLGHSPKFDADNVPMLLWAFAALNYNPGADPLMCSLETLI